MKYKGYVISKTRIKNPKYSYRAKKGKNVIYAETQKSVKKLIKRVERYFGSMRPNEGGKRKGWFRHSREHRDAYFKGQRKKALARRQFLGHGGKCSNRWVIQKRDTYKWNDYKVFLTRDGAEQFMRTHNKLKFRIFGE